MKTRSHFYWILGIILLIYVLYPIFSKVYTLKQQKEVLQGEIQKLELKNQMLEQELRLIKDDPVYLENLARKKFKKSREGEIVYQIVPQEEIEELN